MLLWPIIGYLIFQVVKHAFGSILTDYERCLSNGFGRLLLVCDPDNVLTDKTHEQLTVLLNELQNKVKCNCITGCERDDKNDSYIGLLMVTNSSAIEEANKSLDETAKHIYDDTQLGNEQCDNGILIIYIKDKQQLAVYRGRGSFILLNTKDMVRLHNVAHIDGKNDDALALQYLLSNRDEVKKAETWTPLIGLLLALALLLLVLALLLALFLARFCCCCIGRRKDEQIYQIGTIRGSKITEPILVATPSSTERIYGTQVDAIYSTPYSGTPIPPQHVPAIYPSSMVSSSQPGTPLSTSRHRIRPVHAPVTRGYTPTSTPMSSNRMDNRKVDDYTQTNGIENRVEDDQKGAVVHQQRQQQASTSAQSGLLPTLRKYTPELLYGLTK